MVAAHSFACPKCGAEVGIKCRDLRYASENWELRYGFHEERLRLADGTDVRVIN